jgi:hypothetical protein
MSAVSQRFFFSGPPQAFETIPQIAPVKRRHAGREENNPNGLVEGVLQSLVFFWRFVKAPNFDWLHFHSSSYSPFSRPNTGDGEAVKLFPFST